MLKGYKVIAIFSMTIFVLFTIFLGITNAQIISPSLYGLPTLPIGITYTPNPLFTLGSLPPIYPYVGDTITAFDSFVWPAGATVPPTSLADISYAVPGVFSSYSGLLDPQIYLSTSFPTYISYLDLYFAAAYTGSTLPGAFGPFGLPSVNAYSGLATTYPYFNYGNISALLAFYALNPVSASYVTLYPII